ncbi:MAG: dienelactone hydrolase family protein [Gemmatimonadales bacterium]|nr:dienelactone hydrolase family protein [Gemmatimonadales bacterium]MEB2318011.1 dienelactone hydrolase family protein [Pseudomonadota bacterium]
MHIQEELQSLAPGSPIDRRGFMLGSIAGGFAVAVAPTGTLLAQTITTPDTGLATGSARVPVGADGLPVYWARPEGRSGVPVVLVIQEIFGVHEHIRDVCRRFAREGYMAVAPELYFRQGDPSAESSIPELVSKIVSKVPDAQVMGDLDAVVQWAGGQDADASRLGITGFCWGGRIVWLYSAHQPKLKAGVAWYGRLVSEPTGNTPKHPADVAASLHAPVLGLYGGADQGIPLDTVEEMKRRLAAGGAAARASEFVVYPEAPHAFHADYRPSYRAEAAADGWRRCLAWMKSNGV